MTKKTYSPFKMGGYPQHAGVSPLKKDNQRTWEETYSSTVTNEVLAANEKEKQKVSKSKGKLKLSKNIKDFTANVGADLAKAAATTAIGKIFEKKEKKEPTRIISEGWKIV